MEIEHSLALSHADQRAEEEARPAENIKHNPKYFSGYCKRFFKTKTQVSPQQDTEGSLSQDAKTTSQMLLLEEYNRVVSSSWQDEIIHSSKGFFTESALQTPLTDITLTMEDMARAIKELNPNVAAGPDGVPAILSPSAARY